MAEIEVRSPEHPNHKNKKQLGAVSRTINFIKKKPATVLIILLLVVLIVLGIQYKNTRDELKRASNPKTASQDETKELTVKIGKLIELPSNETPTTATVNDANKLKNQEFFARAQNGDKVLIYSSSNRAVLYRPSTNKVVEYSKVTFNNTQSQ